MFSLRWKLIAAFLLVVFIPCWLLHRYAIGFFDRYTRRALEDEMVASAYLLGEQYRSAVLEAPDEDRPAAFAAFERLLKTCGPEMQTRIRIVAPSGEVLSDSHDDSSVGQSFSDRPELRPEDGPGSGRDDDRGNGLTGHPVKDGMSSVPDARG